MSVNIDLKDPTTGKVTPVEMPIADLVNPKITKTHKGSALILGIAMAVLWLGIWLIMLLSVIQVEYEVFILPLCLLLAVGVLSAFFWGWGWKGKNLLAFIKTRPKTKSLISKPKF